MRKVLLGLVASLLLSPAFAADNAVIVTPGVGVTMKSTDVGAGVQSMQTIPSTTGGVALPSDSTNGLGVNVKACASGVCGVARTTAITNVSPIAGEVHTSDPSYSNLDSQPPTLGADGSTWTARHASTLGGATLYTPFVPTAGDNHQVVKNGAGTVYKVTTSNNSATANYLRLYDAGTGFNGCNSATGVIFAMEIPPTNGGFSVDIGGVVGGAFSTGLSVCVTSGFGLTDTTNATATAIYVNIAYK